MNYAVEALVIGKFLLVRENAEPKPARRDAAYHAQIVVLEDRVARPHTLILGCHNSWEGLGGLRRPLEREACLCVGFKRQVQIQVGSSLAAGRGDEGLRSFDGLPVRPLIEVAL